MERELNALKVAIINMHREDKLGGSEIQCDNIARLLQSRGHDVLYVAVNGKQDAYKTPYKVKKVEKEALDIVSACNEYAPVIVYWRFNKKLFRNVAYNLHKLSIPVVFSVSHISDVKRFFYRRTHSSSKFKLIKNFIKQMFNSAWNHNGFKYVNGLITNNKDFLYKAPVTLQAYIPNTMTSKSLQFNWGKPFCLWVANIGPRKNPDKFIELAKYFEATGIDFIMVGSSSNNAYFKSILKNNPPTNFYYLGARTLEEVNGMLKESLFLVHTCSPEGFSNIFIQSWLQGKPAVTLFFDPSGFIEKYGLGFYSKTMQQLTIDVDRLINDHELRRTMGNKAYDFAKEHFDSDNNISKLESFLLQACGK